MKAESTNEISAERKAHAPLPATASVDHGVGVGITEKHRNRAAGSGCMTRLDRHLDSSLARVSFRCVRHACHQVEICGIRNAL